MPNNQAAAALVSIELTLSTRHAPVLEIVPGTMDNETPSVPISVNVRVTLPELSGIQTSSEEKLDSNKWVPFTSTTITVLTLVFPSALAECNRKP